MYIMVFQWYIVVLFAKILAYTFFKVVHGTFLLKIVEYNYFCVGHGTSMFCIVCPCTMCPGQCASKYSFPPFASIWPAPHSSFHNCLWNFGGTWYFSRWKKNENFLVWDLVLSYWLYSLLVVHGGTIKGFIHHPVPSVFLSPPLGLYSSHMPS